MPNFDDTTWLDATALAELVRKREVSPLELVDAAIARIERVNPQLNAVVTPMFRRGPRRRAERTSRWALQGRSFPAQGSDGGIQGRAHDLRLEVSA
jgi:Asp-tRNA(Asn)/Glu-tRNA(Gln) amidotransferase A subunit family amidase